MASVRMPLHVEMEDGTEYDVVADQRDYARWEAQYFGTPTTEIDSKPMLAARFLAYSALNRTNQYTKVWETFEAQCVEVTRGQVDNPLPGKKAR